MAGRSGAAESTHGIASTTSHPMEQKSGSRALQYTMLPRTTPSFYLAILSSPATTLHKELLPAGPAPLMQLSSDGCLHCSLPTRAHTLPRPTPSPAIPGVVSQCIACLPPPNPRPVQACFLPSQSSRAAGREQADTADTPGSPYEQSTCLSVYPASLHLSLPATLTSRTASTHPADPSTAPGAAPQQATCPNNNPSPSQPANQPARRAQQPHCCTRAAAARTRLLQLQQLGHGHTTGLGHLLQGLHAGQRLDGGARSVQRRARAQALGQAVLHARQLQHRAHHTAGNTAGAAGRGHQHHAAGVELGLRLVGDGVLAHQGHADHVLARVHQRALDRHGDLAAGGAAHAHQAVAVADNGDAAEAHDLATLDHLGHARHLNDTLHPLLAVVLVLHGVLRLLVVLAHGQQLGLSVSHLLQLLSQGVGRQLAARDGSGNLLLARLLLRDIVLGGDQVLLSQLQLLRGGDVLGAHHVHGGQRAQLSLQALIVVLLLSLQLSNHGVVVHGDLGDVLNLVGQQLGLVLAVVHSASLVLGQGLTSKGGLDLGLRGTRLERGAQRLNVRVHHLGVEAGVLNEHGHGVLGQVLEGGLGHLLVGQG
mmetsp:Transcript_36072/g.91148  ORF Transcript_36072/g.91148 Transcript_36072/m.91148 type:complete len:594 (+) Transcript_36072:121-1902(+)